MTGEITGRPTETLNLTSFTIIGKNQVGDTNTVIRISIRKGRCEVDGDFPITDVGDIYVYDCHQRGSYVGKVKRACALGEKDGEWGQKTGFCVPIALIVIIVIAIVILIVVGCVLAVRYHNNKKQRLRDMNISNIPHAMPKPVNGPDIRSKSSLVSKEKTIELVPFTTELGGEPIPVSDGFGVEVVSDDAEYDIEVIPDNTDNGVEVIPDNTDNGVEVIPDNTDYGVEVVPVYVVPITEM